MEEALIRLCAEFGVQTGRICGLTGVWCHLRWGSPLDESCATNAKSAPQGERKIAAIGIHVARGVTSHGFAFNVTTDLNEFTLINPCGITDRPVTSLEREVATEGSGSKTLPSLESIAHKAARQFGQVFSEQILAVESLDILRTQAKAVPSGAAEDPAPAFPAEDTPLQIPPEIERLRGTKDRPVSA
jgi:lipoyl(octanoyl) transferase